MSGSQELMIIVQRRHPYWRISAYWFAIWSPTTTGVRLPEITDAIGVRSLMNLFIHNANVTAGINLMEGGSADGVVWFDGARI
jgi:hypothetical protein